MSHSRPQGKTTSHPVDQYHHVIPRFILREFQIGPRKTKRERNQEFRKFRFVNERIWLYDMKSGTLESRLIAKAFGVANLYRDVRNIENVNELETKLSELENNAARHLNNLHGKLESNDGQASFTIVRQDLEQLRKFLFLMHYRNEALALSYFSADHPENAPIRTRMINMAQKLNLNSPTETWLHFLRYYLDTPHMQIVMDAMKGAPTLEDPMKVMHYLANADTMAENFEAVTYQLQAGFYYMGIVQAAPGKEFILTNNSFGLWEGFCMGQSALHRLYIMSPRIAIILRLNLLRPEGEGGAARKLLPLCVSDLLDVHLATPITSKPLDDQSGIDGIFQQQIQSRLNKFTFPITKLTTKQTFTINSIALLNGKPDGHLTFANPRCMRSTVRQFWRDKMIGIHEERYKYESLIRQLSYTSPIFNGDIPIETKPTPPIRLHAPLQDLVGAISLGPGDSPPSQLPSKGKLKSGERTKGGKNLSAGSSIPLVHTSSALPMSKIDEETTASKIEPSFPSLPESKGTGSGTLTSRSLTSQAADVKSASLDLAGQMTTSNGLGSSSKSKIKPWEGKSTEEALDKAITQQLLRLAGPPSLPTTHFKCMRALWEQCSAISSESPLYYQHPFIVGYRQLLSQVITRLQSNMKGPAPSFVPRQDSKLVTSLATDADAVMFTTIMDHIMRTLGVADADDGLPSMKKNFSVLVEDVATMGLVSWIARNRHDVLDVLLKGIRIVQDT